MSSGDSDSFGLFELNGVFLISGIFAVLGMLVYGAVRPRRTYEEEVGAVGA